MAASSREGRGSTRAPDSAACTWMAFHQSTGGCAAVGTIAPVRETEGLVALARNLGAEGLLDQLRRRAGAVRFVGVRVQIDQRKSDPSFPV